MRMKVFIYLLITLSLIFSYNETNPRNRAQALDRADVRFVQIGNPDQPAADSGGGDNGEFLRRNQPQEHIIVPLINSLEAEYNPLFSDIRKFRKKALEKDKGIEYRLKEDKELEAKFKKILK